MRRTAIGGLAALVCASTALLVSGAPALADFAASGGTIKIVDKDAAAAGTQGATEVQPGATAQALDDVTLSIPNTFDKNDSIALALFDRSSGVGGAGVTNTDADHKLVFNGTPTVAVSSTGAPAGTVAPTLTVSTAASGRAHGQGNDEVVLTVGNKSAGASNAFTWNITVSGLKVDTGARTTPGEIRLVPFATNGCSNPLQALCAILDPPKASPLFGGNADATTPTIKTYTVPGYVVPAKLTAAAPTDIVADGTSQLVGDLTVSEVSPLGLQAGIYTVKVSGADVKNDDLGVANGNYVKVSLTGPASGESLAGADANGVANATVAQGIGTNPDEISFTLNQTDGIAANNGKVSVVLHGLLLASTTNTHISYTLTGGSVDQYYAKAGASLAISAPTAAGAGFPIDSAFGSTAVVSPADIAGPTISVGGGTSLQTGSRIGGPNRYATAAQVALTSHPKGEDLVILASGEAFPDALSSGFLSQREGGASVLLTKANSLPSATESALRQLGTSHVLIVGGTGAISAAVAGQVATIAVANGGSTASVNRLAGANRYETNKAVNEAAKGLSSAVIGTTTVTFGQASKATAILATGEDFADALASGPATAGNGTGSIPLILTRGDALSQTAQDQLTGFGIKQVVIAGGTAVVSAAVESQLGTLGISVKRLAGTNRYGTATAIADFETAPATPTSAAADGGLGFDPGTTDNQIAGLATGEDYADALAGGPFAASSRSPILLTTSGVLQPDTAAWLTAHKARYSTVTALGLAGAVSDAALQAAQAAIL